MKLLAIILIDIALLLLLILLPATVRAIAVEVAFSLKPVNQIQVGLVSLIASEVDCPAVCFEWGGHAGRAISRQEGRRGIYNFAGLDAYAKITGGSLWARWGFGFSLFNRTDDELETPAAFHLSLVSGWQLGKSLSLILGMHHWSNGEGVAEQLGLEDQWKPNGGGNCLCIGASYEF